MIQIKINAVVAGAGSIATRHLQAVKEIGDLQVVAIADTIKSRAEEMASIYKIHGYIDYKEMIKKEKPDVAIITLPHFLHKEAAVFCANHGCHILLEKPMALNVKECDEIMTTADVNNVQLMVGHTQHYIADNRKAKELIAQQDLGDLVMINDMRHVRYFSDNRPSWFLEKEKSGGGIMMNLGAHSIDKIQWITDSRICKVKAKLSYKSAHGNVEGSGLVYLETSKGVPATIAQSGYLGAKKDETEFIFTGGKIKLQTGKGLWISRDGNYEQVEIMNRTNPFILQLKELLSAVKGDKHLECTGRYAKTVIEVIEAIYRSDERGTGLELEIDKNE